MSKKETNKIEKLIKWNEPETSELKFSNKDGSDEIRILVKHGISLKERVSMARGIYNLVINEDEKRSLDNYAPFLLTYARRWSVINYFTNVELPDNIDTLNEVVMNTNLFETVMDNLPEKTIIDIQSIFYEADLLIKSYVDRAVAGDKFAVIAKTVGSVIDEFTEQFKSIDMKEITGLLSKLKDVDGNKIVETMLKFNKDKKSEQ